MKIICETLKSDNYPWQILASILMKLEFTPLEIAERYGNFKMERLYELCIEFLGFIKIIDEEEYGKSIQILENKLKNPLRNIIKKGDSGAKMRYESLLDYNIGEMYLKDVFSDSPTKNISDWNFRINKYLKEKLDF